MSFPFVASACHRTLLSRFRMEATSAPAPEPTADEQQRAAAMQQQMMYMMQYGGYFNPFANQQ